jgi:hypothetical protein
MDRYVVCQGEPDFSAEKKRRISRKRKAAVNGLHSLLPVF